MKSTGFSASAKIYLHVEPETGAVILSLTGNYKSYKMFRCGQIFQIALHCLLNNMKASTLLLLFFLILPVRSFSSDNFLTVKLPKEVSVQLPKNWRVISEHSTITLDSSVQSRLESIVKYNTTSDLKFASNYYDDANEVAAMFNIRYYPDADLTQQDAKNATRQDVNEFDADLRRQMTKALKAMNATVNEWRGTKAININNRIAFVTEYSRSPAQGKNGFCVRLVRFFQGPKSFTVTISYRLSDEQLLRPICDKIINSIKNN